MKRRTRRNFSGLLLLIVIFVGLLGIVFFQNSQIERDSLPQPTVIPTGFLQRIFPDLEVRNIAAIRLLNPVNGDEFVLARRAEDGLWTAPAYPDRALDTEMASFIAQTIALLPYRQSFDIDEDTDLSQFGLRSTGDFLIQFTTLEGEAHAVIIGEPTFESPTFYSIVDDRPEIYILERAPIDFLIDNFIEPPLD